LDTVAGGSRLPADCVPVPDVPRFIPGPQSEGARRDPELSLETTAEVGGVAESPEKRDFRDVAFCGTRITEFHPAAFKTLLANTFRNRGPPARKKAMQMSY
jgi:hypothetical protein